MSCAPSVKANREPMSSLGHEALGDGHEQVVPPAVTATKTAMVTRGWRQHWRARCGRTSRASRRTRARSPGTSGHAAALRCGRSKRLHSIGVRLSETKPEIRIARHDGDRELVQQAAHDAAHEQHRNEHRRQRERHRQDGEADLARAVECRLQRRLAHLQVAHDVLQHDDGVVHHEAHATASAPSATGCRGCSRAGTSPRTCR